MGFPCGAGEWLPKLESGIEVLCAMGPAVWPGATWIPRLRGLPSSSDGQTGLRRIGRWRRCAKVASHPTVLPWERFHRCTCARRDAERGEREHRERSGTAEARFAKNAVVGGLSLPGWGRVVCQSWPLANQYNNPKHRETTGHIGEPGRIWPRACRNGPKDYDGHHTGHGPGVFLNAHWPAPRR